MSTTKIVCLILMVAGLVVCYFLFGFGVVGWLVLAFIVSYVGIFFFLVGGRSNISLISVAPIFMIATWILGIALFWWLFGWKVALAYFLLYCAFTMVQPNAG